MKTLKLLSLLMFMSIVVGSCDWLFPSHEPMPFFLSLSFQDASGKDLVTGIGYTPESEYFKSQGLVETQFFTLRVFDSEKPKPIYSSDFRYFEDPGSYSHLSFPGRGGTKSSIEITYLLTCPYVFGDDAEHEIVVYCKEKKNQYKCYRLTFDGEDIEFEQDEKVSYVMATVVLD